RNFYMSEGGCSGRHIAVAPSSLSAMSHGDGSCSMIFGADWGGWVDAPKPPAAVTALAFSPDSKLLCVAHGAAVEVWNMICEGDEDFVDETSRRYKLRKHPGVVSGAAFHPDGQSFATACADGLVRFWAADDGKSVSSLDLQAGALGSLAFSP